MNDDWFEELERLIQLACQAKPGSAQRRKRTDDVQRYLCKGGHFRYWLPQKPTLSSDIYNESLALTWLHFYANICEAVGRTTQPYCSQTGRHVVNRLRRYRWYRSLDLRKAMYRAQNDVANIDVEQILLITQEDSDILDELLPLIEADANGILRNTHVRNKPDVNAQILILRRVYDRLSWKELENEFDTPFGTLAAFLTQKALPLLKQLSQELSEPEPIDEIPVVTASIDITDQLRAWAKADPGDILKNTHLRNKTNVNAQVIILQRLDDQPWEEIAHHQEVSKGTLAAFYTRRCKPLVEEATTRIKQTLSDSGKEGQ